MEDKLARRLRRLQYVPRWVICPTLREQNVAEHSFHTVWIFCWLAPKMGVDVTYHDLLSVLDHDEEEAVTGDLPSPSKDNGHPDLSTMSVRHRTLKVADCLEAWLFCMEEKSMGNNNMQAIIKHIVGKGSRYDERFMEFAMELWAIVRPDNHPGLIE